MARETWIKINTQKAVLTPLDLARKQFAAGADSSLALTVAEINLDEFLARQGSIKESDIFHPIERNVVPQYIRTLCSVGRVKEAIDKTDGLSDLDAVVAISQAFLLLRKNDQFDTLGRLGVAAEMRAFNLEKEQPSQAIVDAFLLMGKAELYQGSDSSSNFEVALEIASRMPEKYRVAGTYAKIGAIRAEYGQDPRPDFQKAMGVAETIEEPTDTAMAYKLIVLAIIDADWPIEYLVPRIGFLAQGKGLPTVDELRQSKAQILEAIEELEVRSIRK